MLLGCSSETQTTPENFPLEDAELIYEEIQSPNQEYAVSPEDLIQDVIRVYQDSNYKILVEADSNFAFFEKTQYTADAMAPISAENITIQWTTLSGNPEPSENDQLSIAHITISQNGEILSERKINFVSQAVEIIVDGINQNM